MSCKAHRRLLIPFETDQIFHDRYARPDSFRVTATSTIDNVTVAAWTPQVGSFPAGGNLAMQMINNAAVEKTVPISVAYLESITNSTVLILNNDYNLTKDESIVIIDGANITATIPARSLVVLAVDAVWS